MHYHWLHRKGSERLILFFCGWGTDYRPFQSITSEHCDVICLYSYHTGSLPDWDDILASYRQHFVIAWSMGVLQAEIALSDRASQFVTSRAVNGTLLPVHDQFGIPTLAYQLTIDSFSEPSLRKFIQRMCKDRSVISAYNEQLPQRTIAEQKDELIFHQQQTTEQGRVQSCLFTHASISSDDLIFPAEALRNFWYGKVSIEESNSPHFPFYNYASWDAMIDL